MMEMPIIPRDPVVSSILPDVIPDGGAPSRTRKVRSEVYRNWTVTRACGVIKITEKDYKEMDDKHFRDLFCKKVKLLNLKCQLAAKKAVEARMEAGEVDSEEDEENLLRAMNDAEARKNAEKNVRLHEAFQFLLKKRERMKREEQRAQALENMKIQAEANLKKEAAKRKGPAPPKGADEDADSWDSQDLSDLEDEDLDVMLGMNGSDDENEGANANMVGVGTPPPILVDGQQQPDKPLTALEEYRKKKRERQEALERGETLENGDEGAEADQEDEGKEEGGAEEEETNEAQTTPTKTKAKRRASRTKRIQKISSKEGRKNSDQTRKSRKDEKNSLEVYGNRNRRSSLVETSGKGMLELPTFPGRERRGSLRRASTPVTVKINDKDVDIKRNGLKGLKLA